MQYHIGLLGVQHSKVVESIFGNWCLLCANYVYCKSFFSVKFLDYRRQATYIAYVFFNHSIQASPAFGLSWKSHTPLPV